MRDLRLKLKKLNNWIMLEKILKSKETRKLTKKEQKNILASDYGQEFNCNDATVDKYYAC